MINLKQFLKPDWRKIVIFIILFMLSSEATIKLYMCGLGSCPDGYGFPLEFFYPMQRFKDVINLFIDVIFWYLFSCLIVWIYDKVKKK